MQKIRAKKNPGVFKSASLCLTHSNHGNGCLRLAARPHGQRAVLFLEDSEMVGFDQRSKHSARVTFTASSSVDSPRRRSAGAQRFRRRL